MKPTVQPALLKALRPLAAATLALFCLGAAQAASWGDNLIVNAGADAGPGGDGGSAYAGNLPGWAVTGEMMAVDYSLGCPGGYPCTTDPVPADHGVNHFAGGNVGLSTATQTIDLSFAGSSINGTGAVYSLSGWLGGYASQADNAQLSVSFLNAANQVVGSSAIGPVTAAERANATALLYREASNWVPQGAVSAEVTLTMTRAGGTSNDGYADSLGLVLQQGNVELAAPTSVGVGSSFNVTVAVLSPFGGSYAGDELLAFGFNLGFDSNVVQLTNVAVAQPWDDDSGFFPDVAVAGSVFESLTDDGAAKLQLATLTFQAVGAGDALIDVHSAASSTENQGLTYLAGNNLALFGRTAVSVTAVPEPSQWLMLAGGLGVLAARLRRRA